LTGTTLLRVHVSDRAAEANRAKDSEQLEISTHQTLQAVWFPPSHNVRTIVTTVNPKELQDPGRSGGGTKIT
jgi:hypothetical protein